MKDMNKILKVGLLATASLALVACGDSSDAKKNDTSAVPGGSTPGSIPGSTPGSTPVITDTTTATALADGMLSSEFVTEATNIDQEKMKLPIGTTNTQFGVVNKGADDFALRKAVHPSLPSPLDKMTAGEDLLASGAARIFLADKEDFFNNREVKPENWRNPSWSNTGNGALKLLDDLHFASIGMVHASKGDGSISGLNVKGPLSVGFLNLAGTTGVFNSETAAKDVQVKYLYVDGRAQVHLQASADVAANKSHQDYTPAKVGDACALWLREANLNFTSLPSKNKSFGLFTAEVAHNLSSYGVKSYVAKNAAGQDAPTFWVDGELGAKVTLNDGALLMTLNPGHVEIVSATAAASSPAKLDAPAKTKISTDSASKAAANTAKNAKAAASKSNVKLTTDPHEKLAVASVDRGSPFKFVAKDVDGVTPTDRFQYVHEVVAGNATILLNPSTPMVGKDWTVSKDTNLHVIADSKYFLPIEAHGSLDTSTKLYDEMVLKNSFAALMASHDEAQSKKVSALDAAKTTKKAGDTGALKKAPTTANGTAKKTVAKTTKTDADGNTKEVTHLSTNLPFALYLRNMIFTDGEVNADLEILPNHEDKHLANGTYVLPVAFVVEEPTEAAKTKMKAKTADSDTVLLMERTDKVDPSHKIKGARYRLIQDATGHDMAIILEIKDSTLESNTGGALYSALKGSMKMADFNAVANTLDAAKLSAKAFDDVSSLKAQAAGARFNLARHTLANTGFASEANSFGNSFASASSFKLGDSFRLAISNASNSNAKVNGFALAHGFGQAVAMFTAQAATTGAKTDKVTFSGAQFDVNAAVATSFTVAGLSVTPMASVGFTTFATDGYNAAVKLGKGVAHVEVDSSSFNAVNTDFGVQFALNAPKSLVSSSATFGVQAQYAVKTQYASGNFDMKVNGNSFDVKHDLDGVTPYAQFHLNLGDVDTSLNVNSRAVGFSFNFAN